MAKVIPIGQPVNDAERLAIAHLRDHLPDAYTVLHNFELTQGAESFEIDLIVLAPHGVYVVDVKGTRGLIDIYGAKWYPEGRAPYHSPLAKLRQHARILKSLICDAFPERRELGRIHVHAAVLMTAQDAKIVDPEGRDGSDVTYLNKCVAYFRSKAHIPENRADDIRPLLPFVEKAIRGKARPRSAPPCYREWQVEEKLGGDDRYTEYRAKHTLIGQRGGAARLRVYRVDPYQDEAARQAERTRISNAFRAVAHMPGHPNILTVRDFFPTEDDDFLVLVTEDVPGQALRQHIKKPNLVLTFDQKLSIMRDVLAALAHAHTYDVVHRNLTPDAIVVGAGGHARVGAFDYARVGQSRASTIAHEIIDDLDPAFQAPECYRDPSQASIASDLFSTGLVFYYLLSGEPAFENMEQVFDREATFPVKPSELKPDLPVGFDDWLQKLCAFTPEHRFPSAAAALQELETLVTPAKKERPSSPENDTQTQQAPNLLELPRDYTLAGRFVIQERLGRPGGFAVAYKVFDAFGDVIRVLKLITHDRRSIFERLRREYTTLTQLPDHPYVAKVIWADRLPDETPYTDNSVIYKDFDFLGLRDYPQ
jgi:serine/threonine protein kinase